MCGIVGILGKEPVALHIVEALKRLEYRGYDSAGVATLESGEIGRRRAPGKLRNLEARLTAEPLLGTEGIGHTRWATHGAATETNAHPHMAGDVVIVHNGIIENFRPLKDELIADGHVFATQTDTEVVAHLIARERQRGKTPREAVKAVLSRLEGAFALAILFKGESNLLIGARKGSPLAIGHGNGEMFLGSDAIALAPFTNKVTYLGRWRLGCTHAHFGRDLRQSEPPCEAGHELLPGFGHAGGQGQPPPLHGKGNRGTAGSHRPHSCRVRGFRGTGDPLAREAAVRFRHPRPHHHHGLRYGVICGTGRQVLVRKDRAPADGGRYRLRIPLPGGPASEERPGDRRLPVRRDGRYAGSTPLLQEPGTAYAGYRQCTGIHHCARKRAGLPDLCRARDRRCIDKGLHLPAHRVGLPGHTGRQTARHHHPRSGTRVGWST